MYLFSLYIHPHIGATTSYVFSGYFYSDLITLLVSDPYYTSSMVYNSLCPSVLFPLYFSFMGVHFSSSFPIHEISAQFLQTWTSLHKSHKVKILVLYIFYDLSKAYRYCQGMKDIQNIGLGPSFLKTPTLIAEIYYQLQRDFLILDSTKNLDTKP